MRYPMLKSTRAKLVGFYYNLCLLPGIDIRTFRSWSDMISRLCNNKPGQKRKLESADLELPWRPLWRIIEQEPWNDSGYDWLIPFPGAQLIYLVPATLLAIT